MVDAATFWRIIKYKKYRLYLNYKSTQTNIANIDDKEIIKLAAKVKEEMLKVLQEIEGVITILQNQNRSTP